MDLLLPEHSYLINIAAMGGLFVIFILPWAYALYDVLSNEFRGDQKPVRVIVLLTMGTFGAIMYFLIGRGQKKSARNLETLQGRRSHENHR